MIEQILEQRGGTHGDYAKQAQVSDAIITRMQFSPNWGALTPEYRQALTMIAVKTGRILSGNPDEPDHWHDIAGYATLASRTAEQRRTS